MARRVRAKYRTVPLGSVTREVNACSMDKETLSLQQEKKSYTEEMYMVHFPPKAKGIPGHSIRVNKAELVRLGFHLRPRLVDMDTGDIVDTGGDSYDFAADEKRDDDLEVMLINGDEVTPDDDQVDEEMGSSKRAKEKVA